MCLPFLCCGLPMVSSFVDPAEQPSPINSGCGEPIVHSFLTQSGTGTVRTWPPLPTKSTMTKRIDVESHRWKEEREYW